MIAIICAMKQELDEILKLMYNFKSINIYSNQFYIGTINQKKCVAGLCGVGKVNAAICTQTLIMEYTPKAILNVGVAGSIDENVKIGDVVIADATIQHDFDISAFSHRKKGEISGINSVEIKTSKHITDKLIACSEKIKNLTFHCGTVLTGDQFISSKEKLIDLKNEFGGLACEMEAGSIAQTCLLNGISCGIIRAISDSANSSSTLDFNSFIQTSSKNAAILIDEFTKLI